MKQGIFEIKENTEIADGVWKMKLEGDTSAISAPGQFVNIRLDGHFLRRPISVCDLENEVLTLIYKTVGAGTLEMSRMENGIDSSVGEHGHGLSEGQAQRIAIARAVLRDAPIMLLDEATSALDVATERQVLRSIMLAHPNKTCIVTTHRPSVLGMCSRVYRVHGGTVEEIDARTAEKLTMDY